MKTQLVFFPDEITKKRVDECLALGVDVLGIHPGGGDEACSSLDKTLEWLEKDETKKLLDYAADNGMEIEYEIHAGGFLAPRELFASHPEYFREKNGERTPDYNLCPSCDEVLSLVAENAAALVKRLYRSSHNYYLWMDDFTDCWCSCPSCAALTASDQNALVMNRILERLKRDDPDARLAYLAYYETITPPVSVKPADGIFCEYAPIKRDRKINVADDEIVKTQLNELFKIFAPDDVKVLEYWYDNSMFSEWKRPPRKFVPDNSAIKSEIEYYRSLGCEYVSSFACFTGADYVEAYGDPDFSAIGK